VSGRLAELGDVLRCAGCGHEARVVARHWRSSLIDDDGVKQTHIDPVPYLASTSERLPRDAELCSRRWWRRELELDTPELVLVVPDDGNLPEREIRFLYETRRLMAGNVIERPCRYAHHAGSIWFGHAGQPICGVCHPQVRP
jgi:hypothetical protein